MRNARAGIVTLLIVAALSLYALASLASTKAEAAKYAAYRDELLAEAGALESENARLTEEAHPGPGGETAREAGERAGQSPAGQTSDASIQQTSTGG